MTDILKWQEMVNEAFANGSGRTPERITGERYTVWDMLLDSGAAPLAERYKGAPRRLRDVRDAVPDPLLGGIPVVFDDTMPKGVVDVRDPDGRTTARLLRVGSGWVSVDAEQLQQDWPLEFISRFSEDA